MTPQEIFDTALNGVIKQGRKSTDENGDCAYLTREGLRCGVGHLVSEDVAHRMDAMSSDSRIETLLLTDEGRKIIPDYLRRQRSLLINIQNAHDMAEEGPHFVENFIERMKAVASLHELEFKV